MAAQSLLLLCLAGFAGAQYVSLRGVKANGTMTPAAKAESIWSGQIRFGISCLGIDQGADMGYAVLPQECKYENGHPVESQHWLLQEGRMRLASCTGCVAPPPPEGFCWDLFETRDNPYFAQGQVVLHACNHESSTQFFSVDMTEQVPAPAQGKHIHHGDGKCVHLMGDAVSGWVLQTASCGLDPAGKQCELFDFNPLPGTERISGIVQVASPLRPMANETTAVAMERETIWSGQILFGISCLGIDQSKDIGYAVLPQECKYENGNPVESQYWHLQDGRMRLASCTGCVVPPPPEGYCWDLFETRGNPHFAQGQVVLRACNDKRSTQSYSVDMTEQVPAPAQGKHIHHTYGKCIHLFGDAVSGWVMQTASCDFNPATEQRELFGLHSK